MHKCQGLLEQASSRNWQKEVFGAETQHCLEGRTADMKTKRNLPRWLKLLVFAGRAAAHRAPFSSTVQFWLPATTAELQMYSPTRYSVICLLSVIHPGWLTLARCEYIGEQSWQWYFRAPKIHCVCHLSRQRAKAASLTVHWEQMSSTHGLLWDPL